MKIQGDFRIIGLFSLNVYLFKCVVTIPYTQYILSFPFFFQKKNHIRSAIPIIFFDERYDMYPCGFLHKLSMFKCSSVFNLP